MSEIPGKGWWRKGKVWISAIAVSMAFAGWFSYDSLLSPQWMRSFGLDMAARATIVSTSTGDTVFSTMKGRADPDNPFICLTHSASFPWDRVYVVPSKRSISASLAAMDWDGEDVESLRRRMVGDDRYQLIAFTREGRVVDHGYYYTMWADLSALGRAQGFSRDEAVFLADSNGTTYTLTVADSAPTPVCP